MLVARAPLLPFLALFFIFPSQYRAQAPPAGSAILREVHAEGTKSISSEQVLQLSNLEIGKQVARTGLQGAADKLVQSGLFATVKYNFRTLADGVVVTFALQEAPRIPAYYDNIPWFGDEELHQAIRRKLPFFDDTLPEAGNAVDLAAEALDELLTSHGLKAAIEHQVVANPLGEGMVQQFQIQGATLQIAKLEFSDPALSASRAIQQHLSEILGKPYSRMTIELFLSEQVRPVYLHQGYLRVKLGPPQVRLTGNPNQKLPEQIPVFIPVSNGPVYHWQSVTWTGNNLLSTITLTQALGLKPGDVADGLAIEAGFERVREEYAHRGYLRATVEPSPTYDDAAHTVSYSASVREGAPFKFGKLVLTGLSVAAERKLREAWPLAPGEFFDKTQFEDFLTRLQAHREQIFKDLPIHFDNVGHWLQTDESHATVDVLLDFK